MKKIQPFVIFLVWCSLILLPMPLRAADLTLSADMDDFLTSANYTAARTKLALTIGTNVQAYDADLTTWAGVTPGTGVATFLATPSSANFRGALTDESGTGVFLTVNGVGAALTLTASGFDGNLATTDDTLQEVAQKVDDLVAGSGSVATDTIWNAAGDLVYGTGSDTASRLAIGTAGQVLQVNTGATAPEWSSTIDVTTVDATSLEIGGVAVTSTAAELNILDGVTSTAAELNILDGVTSTAAELNALDGITSTVTELNYTDGVTSAIQTQMDTKAAKAIVTKTVTGAYTVGTTDANELYGGVLYVTSAATVTIPAVAAGASFTVITIGAIAVSVDPNASDLIYLDGTALSDGDKVTNTSTAGDIAVFTYYDATGWYCSSNTWTDGN